MIAGLITKLTRNQEIRERYAQGETIVDLAEAFEISEQHVSQVLRGPYGSKINLRKKSAFQTGDGVTGKTPQV
jgi:Mor family transcriptional regulator